VQLQLKYWLIPALITLLGLISIVTLRSVAAQFATQQLIFFAIGLTLFWVVSRLSFSFVMQYRWLAYLGLIGLLVLTLLVGSLTRNTRRWISVGGLFSIQGSQLAAPVVGLAASQFLAHYTDKLKPRKGSTEVSWKVAFQLLGLIGIPAALIVVAPDLGSTLFYLGSVGIIFLLGPIPWRMVASFAGLAIITSVLAWFFFLQEYQKDRIYCFIAPETVVGCSTYNADQSLIAVGSGRIFGRGLGQGIQSYLQFLPERQTDFIFASFAEEWGLVGSLMLLGIYAILIGYIIWVGFNATKTNEYYYCMIMVALLTFQTAVHIGMNMYLFPIKGISLPLVSYGGSSLVGMMLGLGLIQSIASNQKPKLERHFG
jgi:rod shape determining protein RodA